MVTAELAVTLLAVMALLTMMCWGIYLLMLQVRITDTAAGVARQAARGDVAGAARARREAPRGAQVRTSMTSGTVAVEVRLTARPLARGLGELPLRARAEVVAEPGVRSAR